MKDPKNMNYQELSDLKRYVETLMKMHSELYYLEKGEKSEKRKILDAVIQMKECHKTCKEIGTYLWGNNYYPYYNKRIDRLYELSKQETEREEYLKTMIPEKNRTYYKELLSLKETENETTQNAKNQTSD